MATQRTFSFTHNGQNVKIDYHGNYDLNNPGANVDNIVVVQHGISGNAGDYADYAISSAQLHGESSGTYGVIAVEFDTDSARESDNPYWNGTNWKFGDLSLDASPGPRISSFDVMNAVLAKVAQNEGSDTEVVVTGHSAGGQFAARYAAGGNFDPLDAKGIDHAVVIANPSSYMFFNNSVNYPYGTANLNNYMGKIGVTGLKENFKAEDVTVFLGTEDTGTADLDMSKQAMAQGDNRLERGENFYAHIKGLFNSPGHNLEYAEGIGHSGGGMYRHADGQDLLWDYDFS